MAWRNIKPNHSNSTPRRIICFDTETVRERRGNSPTEFNHFLRCGCLVSLDYKDGKARNRQLLHFDDSRQFWHWLDCILSRQYTTWVVAHKMSFDFGVIGGWCKIDSGEFELDSPRAKRVESGGDEADIKKKRGLCVIDDPPFILGLRDKRGGRCVFVDTLNWFRQPLKDLGASIGIEKLEMPTETAHINEWRTYCQRDVEIVERAFTGLIDFTRDKQCGMFRYTAPAQSMAAFRHSHMRHKIVLHDDVGVKKLERESYLGGDVRLFYRGKYSGTLIQYDVNGLYPFVMRDNLFPSKLIGQSINSQETCVPHFTDTRSSVSEVTIDSQSRPFPVRSKLGIIFPVGRYRTTLAGPELSEAENLGAIVTYHNSSIYKLEPIFRQFVEYFYALRCEYRSEGNKTYDALCKMLLNSLYGKFGQRSFKWRERPDLIAPSEWYRWLKMDGASRAITLYRSIGKYVFESPAPEEHPDSFPAIASFVTSYAREYMRKLREICGEKNVLYQAIDSLVVTPAGEWSLRAADMLHPTELGKLKLVCDCTEAEFRGPGNYTLGLVDKRSGLRSGSKRISESTWYQEFFENADSQVGHKPVEAIKSWQTIFTDRKRPVQYAHCAEGWLTPLEIKN